MGVLNSSMPSRKNGRFSGRKIAKRWFVEITATSDSIWEKSGLIVASSADCAVGVHLMSAPAFEVSGRVTIDAPSMPSRGSPIELAVTYGAVTKWPPGGRPANPTTSPSLHTKQFAPRGILLVYIW